MHLNMPWLADIPKQGYCITVIEGANILHMPIRHIYRNMEYSRVCREKAKAFDNAAMESFFGTRKDECVRETFYASHEEARSELFIYVL